MATFDVVARMYADTAKFSMAMQLAGQDMARVESKAVRASRVIGAALATGFIAAPIIKFVSTAVKQASSLEETMSKVSRVFGASSRSMVRWAEDAPKALLMTRQSALDAASSFHIMLKNTGLAADKSSDMSRSLVKLAADMGSFHDQDPSEMLQRIRSGLAGEIEPLRRFGIELSAATIEQEALRVKQQELGRTLTDAEKTITPAEKALARYNVMMAQAKDVQDDVQITAESHANSVRRLNAEWEDGLATLGEEFMPVATKVVSALTSIITGWKELDASTKTSIVGFTSFTIVVGTLSIALMKLKQLWSHVTVASAESTAQLSLFGETAQKTTPILGRFGGGLAGLGTAAAAAIGALLILSDAQADYADTQEYGLFSQERFINQLERVSKYGGTSNPFLNVATQLRPYILQAQEVQKETERINELLDDLSQVSGLSRAEVAQLAEKMGVNLVTANKKAVIAFEEMAIENGILTGALTDTEQTADHFSDVIAQVAGSLRITQDEAGLLADKFGIDLSANLAVVQGAMATGIAKAGGLELALSSMKLETGDAAAELEGLRAQLDSIFGTWLNTEKATLQYNEALAALKTKVEENQVTGDEWNTKLGENQNALFSAADATQALIDKLLEQGEKQEAEARRTAFIDHLNSIAQTADEKTRAEIQRVIDKLQEYGTLNPTASVNVTDNASEKLQKVSDSILRIGRNLGIDMSALVKMWGYKPGAGPGYAQGGILAAGSGGGKINRVTAITGEETPAHPEYVIPTNPAYRKRALSLMASAADDLGLTGLAGGGTLPSLLHDVGTQVMDIAAARVTELWKWIDRYGSKGGAAAQEALKHVGKPYVWGATGPGSFDCSGLTSYAWRQGAGVSIPRVSHDQINAAQSMTPAAALSSPGALLYKVSSASPSGGHIFLSTGDKGAVNAKGSAYGVVREMPASSFQKAGMPVFDNGGTLWPGANMVYNGTGSPEHLSPSDNNITINVTVQGNVRTTRELASDIWEELTILQKRNGGLGLNTVLAGR